MYLVFVKRCLSIKGNLIYLWVHMCFCVKCVMTTMFMFVKCWLNISKCYSNLLINIWPHTIFTAVRMDAHFHFVPTNISIFVCRSSDCSTLHIVCIIETQIKFLHFPHGLHVWCSLSSTNCFKVNNTNFYDFKVLQQ